MFAYYNTAHVCQVNLCLTFFYWSFGIHAKFRTDLLLFGFYFDRCLVGPALLKNLIILKNTGESSESENGKCFLSPLIKFSNPVKNQPEV